MSNREEQCNKVCRILDDILANRPTERDSLIVAVRKAFEALELFGNSEQLPSAQPERKTGRWTKAYDGNDDHVKCTGCFKTYDWISQAQYYNFCPNCGADMRGDQNED